MKAWKEVTQNLGQSDTWSLEAHSNMINLDLEGIQGT